jgi:hypothetical protein
MNDIPFNVIFTSQQRKSNSLVRKNVKIFIEDRLDFANEIVHDNIKVEIDSVEEC